MTSIPAGEGAEVAEGGVGEAVWEAASRVAAAADRLVCVCVLFVEIKQSDVCLLDLDINIPALGHPLAEGSRES